MSPSVSTPTFDMTILYLHLKFHCYIKMIEPFQKCDCVDYDALRRRVTQPEAEGRTRAIEHIRNSLLDPSMFVF